MAEISKDIQEELKVILEQFSIDTIAAMVKIIKNNNKIATANLIRSFGYKIVVALDKVSTEIDYADYGVFVDEGRKAGKQPPISKIREWCRVKGIPQGAAFPIARKIGRRGYRGINFTNAFDKNVKELDKILEDRFGEFLKVEIEKYILKKN